ncbi:hypothetical protein ACFP2T_08590 [Plantactinospora solaniradicis]|uniref:Uncharacterized protein n=1 Tax=Plantactinospora solaniradicis TaxID=1723736 RepID=A0ABW1K7I4_9ACTN
MTLSTLLADRRLITDRHGADHGKPVDVRRAADLFDPSPPGADRIGITRRG